MRKSKLFQQFFNTNYKDVIDEFMNLVLFNAILVYLIKITLGNKLLFLKDVVDETRCGSLPKRVSEPSP